MRLRLQTRAARNLLRGDLEPLSAQTMSSSLALPWPCIFCSAMTPTLLAWSDGLKRWRCLHCGTIASFLDRESCKSSLTALL